MKKRISVALAFLALFSAPAVAADLFSIRIEVDGGEPRTFSFSNAEDAINQFEEGRFDAAFPNYTDMSTAKGVLDFRGLVMRLEFLDATSKLVFEAPSLDIRETFTGDDRDGSLDELVEFLKDQGGDILNRIQAALIAQSPVDPIAGNPGSMMGNMISQQYELGFSGQVTGLEPDNGGAPAAEEGPAAAEASSNPENLIHIAPRFGRLTAGGRTTKVVTLPIGYSFRLKEGAERGLRSVDLSLPITWANTEGGESYAFSFNTGLTWGVNDRWSLSPSAGAGLAGSRDLGAAGGVGSVSLTSAVSVPLRGTYSLNIGNMVGFYRTLDVEIGKYSFDPGVSNTVLRNGLMISRPWKAGTRGVVTEVWITDTRFFGSDLYSEYYDELGISFGMTREKEGKRSIRNWLRGGVSYLTGDGVEGWRANLGFRF